MNNFKVNPVIYSSRLLAGKIPRGLFGLEGGKGMNMNFSG